MGKIQKSFAAFSFPTAITKDFRPLDLSASWSGNEAIKSTRDDKTPTTIHPRIDSMVICPDWI